MDFASTLEQPANDIPEPKNLPQGTYIWAVSKVPAISQSKSGEWDIVEFPIRTVSAEDDVDADEVEEFGPVAGQMGRISFMFPTDPDKKNDHEKSMDRMKKFMLNTLQAGDDTMTMKELMAGSVNCQFLAIATHRIVGDDVFLDVKNYSPID
jgi:hypothetical protein